VAADGIHSSIIAWPQIGLAVLPNESVKIHGNADVANGQWAHVAAVLDTCGHWLLHADGKLVGERQPRPVVTFP